jgi:peptide/nickel transport system permease protein
MSSFLIRRVAFVFVSLIGATAIVFALSRMAGDPILLYAKPYGYGDTEKYLDELRRHLGLDQPLVVQYVKWVWQLAQGDLGLTLLSRRPVIDVIGEKIWNTFQLAFTGWIFATILGVPLGVLSAVKRGTYWDYLGRGFALFGQALPAFWVGVMLVLLFSVTWEMLPTAFKAPPSVPDSYTHWNPWGFYPEYFILPTITIGWGAAAGYLRITRSAMLEVLDSEFVKLARAKGASNSSVVWKHAFKNALIPPLTVSALLLAGLMNGAVVAEVVFAWPGLGRIALVEAVNNNDFPLLTGAIFIFTIIYLVMNFVADMLYAWADPRIRYS